MEQTKTHIDQGSRLYYGFNPERYELFGDVPLRLNLDLRKTVAFVGHTKPDTDGKDVFKPGGTAFFLEYGGAIYLVTARHVAERLKPTFSLRTANIKGEPIYFQEIKDAEWFFHPDESVDLAIVGGAPPEIVGIGEKLILTPDLATDKGIGIGDEVYIVGLYRLLHGDKQNYPIVHTGNIAMAPEGKIIPQHNQHTGKTHWVEGYLIEVQTLEGLSGSPVFVCEAIRWEPKGQKVLLMGDAFLLGVWSGAWDAPPGEVLSIEHPEAKRVPVGMGLAVPCSKLLELFELPEVAKQRTEQLAKEAAVKQDSDLPMTNQGASSKKDKNPKHREDFNSLMEKAVPKKK